MSDPVKEAAQRVRDGLDAGLKVPSSWTPTDYEFGVLAAMQALMPIRELHKPLELKSSVFNGDGTFIGQRVAAVVCGHCFGRPQVSGHCDDCEGETCEGTVGPYLSFTWPCATARLVYSSEELS